MLRFSKWAVPSGFIIKNMHSYFASPVYESCPFFTALFLVTLKIIVLQWNLWSILLSSYLQLYIISHLFYVENVLVSFFYHTFLNHILTLLNNLGRGCPVVLKLQYKNEMEYVLRLSERSFIILLFQMLATSLGLTRPSSGQYLLKLKNAGAWCVLISY
jgi:hypothetical protein